MVTIRGHETMTDEERAKRIAQYIEQDPRRPWPGSERIKDFHTPVWALVGHYKYSAGQSLERVAQDYQVPMEAVEAAMLLYRTNRRARVAIDGHLAANEPSA